MAFEALCNLASATVSSFTCPFSSLPTHLVATLTSFFQQIQKKKHLFPASGPLHLLFPPLGVLSLHLTQLFAYLILPPPLINN